METQKESTLLARALNFYANQRNWTPQSEAEGISAIDSDEGELARDILEMVERYGDSITILNLVSAMESIEHVPLVWWPNKIIPVSATPVSEKEKINRRCPMCYELAPHHGIDCRLKKQIDGFKLLLSILKRLDKNEARLA